MEDFNCDEMIDRAVYGDRITQHATEPSVKDDVIVCPKACLLFCYTLKSMYFFLTKRVHTKRIGTQQVYEI